MLTRLVKWQMRRDLRRAFRRVAWAGPPPALPTGEGADAPVVLYANHQHFYDGHLLQVLLTERLERPGTIWMEDWDRFPFFAAVGAQPFPPGESEKARARRRTTVRRTARRLRETPQTVLIHFPEGRLHPPREDLLPFPEGAFSTLARLFPDRTRWWPVALRVAQTGHARPTALLAGGEPRASAPDGHERERLDALLETLRETPPGEATHTLLGGRRGPDERWDLSWTAPFFERYL